MEHTGCVVIELGRADEWQLLQYLSERVYCYNWILKGNEEGSRVRVCVWWRKDYKQFSTTPLRSFLKRLKDRTVFEVPKVSGRMRTEEGVQRVCKGVCGSISKYYLEEPLYTHLRGLLSVETPLGNGESGSGEPSETPLRNGESGSGEPSETPLGNGESGSGGPSGTPLGDGESGSGDPCTSDNPAKHNLVLKIKRLSETVEKVLSCTPDNLAKLELILEIKGLSEAVEKVLSLLITHTGEPPSLFTQPEEQGFPFDEPIIPIIPSAPLMF